MITGLQTEYCIDATVKSGFDRGFEIIVPAHCHTTVANGFLSPEKSYRYYHEMIWDKRYAHCVSFGSALNLVRKCGIHGRGLRV